ncbi:MAG: hypothetical protein N4A54_14300 [Peptostreptococcaceae bacterium]|jgi:hypothetical protein|nr:hypothetical protein [Peptostreptococcaceae bacterium]
MVKWLSLKDIDYYYIDFYRDIKNGAALKFRIQDKFYSVSRFERRYIFTDIDLDEDYRFKDIHSMMRFLKKKNLNLSDLFDNNIIKMHEKVINYEPLRIVFPKFIEYNYNDFLKDLKNKDKIDLIYEDEKYNITLIEHSYYIFTALNSRNFIKTRTESELLEKARIKNLTIEEAFKTKRLEVLVY